MLEREVVAGRTRKKHDEAKFFLDLMESNFGSFPDFNYYVSAFISAARSVTWVMRAEYQTKEGWEAWYDARQPTIVDDKFLKDANELRVRSVKSEPVQTNVRVTLDIPLDEVTPELREFFHSLKPAQLAQMLLVKEEDVKNRKLGGRQVLAFGEVTKTTMYVDEFPEHDILELGRKYVAELEGLMQECESKFPL
jgi:hypothetical protein